MNNDHNNDHEKDVELEEDAVDLSALVKLSSDLKKGAKELTVGQARYLVDTYYQVQSFRIEAKNQARAAGELDIKVKGVIIKKREREPNEFTNWVGMLFRRLEGSIKTALGEYARSHRAGRWSQSIDGIGPVISAGLLAYIDITKTKSAGSILRFAGLDPSQEWLGKDKSKVLVTQVLEEMSVGKENKEEKIKGKKKVKKIEITLDMIATCASRSKLSYDTILKNATKKDGSITKESLISSLSRRPWNGELKVLTWKIGKSFEKVSGKSHAFYGQHYVKRKVFEHERNKAGRNKERSALILTQKDWTKGTKSREAYEQGVFPDAHVNAMARRWLVSLFLSHYYDVLYESTYGKKPQRPYVFEYGEHKHVDFISPPNWPIE